MPQLLFFFFLIPYLRAFPDADVHLANRPRRDIHPHQTGEDGHGLAERGEEGVGVCDLFYCERYAEDRVEQEGDGGEGGTARKL